MLYFIKLLTIILCSFYTFHKLIPSNTSRKHLIKTLIYCILISLIFSHVMQDFPYLTLFSIILFSFAYLQITCNLAIELTLTATIISYGINYALYIVCNFLIALLITLVSISDLIDYISLSPTIVSIIARILTTLVQFLSIRIIFSINRLKNGMPFLTNKLNSTTIILISFLLLQTYSVISTNTSYNSTFIALYPITFFIATALYINWRNNITKTYIDRVRKQDIDSLNEHFTEIETRYKEIEADKEHLASIIHRDNKIVPAMLLAVKTFLTEHPDPSSEMQIRGKELLKELEQMSEDRADILKEQDSRCNIKLLQTGIPYLDDVLHFIQEQAFKDKIELSVSADKNLDELIEWTLSAEELKTLVADLLTNAMIANRHAGGKRILFSIANVDNALCISIFDTGIPFAKEVLVDFGLVKHTTHENDGGSGIGLMTIFEITKRHKATIIIDEYHTSSALYTKRIAILFNRRGKYVLTTARPKDEILYLKQRNDLTIIEQTDNKM